ncbi:hypothetical protein K1T71_010490 [Dendrolimus kikuchii]|uniref:Uncharacterized protein n=1 Tax=Dendrolimus kikuchii TaxID=765133 RepID=A0ACC1CRN7_9NEOP|nr:hypothetical protein K1T71_010490 [Dendrolimus kikuchii]
MMFCCGCLNTEAVLRRLDKKETYDLQEFLGLKVLDGDLYKYICWICYTALKKSIKFKEQCFDARSMYLNMVLVSIKSLHNLYMLNFKPNLTQSEVVLINIDLENKEESSLPIIQEIKSEVPDEGTFTNVDDTGSHLKVNLKEEIDLNLEVDILSDINVKNDSDDSSEDYEIVPEAILSMTNKESNEEFCMTEGASAEKSDLNEDFQKRRVKKLV